MNPVAKASPVTLKQLIGGSLKSMKSSLHDASTLVKGSKKGASRNPHQAQPAKIKTQMTYLPNKSLKEDVSVPVSTQSSNR